MPYKNAMKLYLISQSVANGCDTYDSAVVAARTAKKARKTHPRQFVEDPWDDTLSGVWATKPEQVTADLIGYAKIGTKAGVICHSFNAG